MDDKGRKERIKEIKNFIFVLLGGILSALFVAGLLVYYFNPTNSYQINKILINPETVNILVQSNELSLGTIKYSYFEGKGVGWKDLEISKETYSKFYESIRKEQSLKNVGYEITREFDEEKPASLYITMAPLKNKKKGLEQEVQLLSNGMFRVKLHQDFHQDQWAYFYQDEIYQKTMKLFTSQL